MKLSFLHSISSLYSRKSIAFKVAVLAWIIIALTITAFIVFSIPYQRATIIERMKSEASDIAASIVHANSSSLITEEYSYIVEHCVNLVKGSESILYITIVKNDGLALVFQNSGWSIDPSKEKWISMIQNSESQFIYSDLANQEVFQFPYKFNYSGIDWGWITVGLSLERYNNTLYDLSVRTTTLGLILIVFGLIASLIFARKLTSPIRILDSVTQKIAEGDLEAKANIKTGDELESLSQSFSIMTDAVKKSRDQLELRVQERTAMLARANEALVNEINERRKAQESLNKYNFRLEALQEIYRGIIKAISVKEIIQQTLSNLNANLLSFKRASVSLYNVRKYSVNVYVLSKDNDGNIKESTESYSLGDFNSVSLFNQRGYKVMNDLDSIKKNKSKMEKIIYDKGLRSYASFQLLFQEKVIGELNIASDRKEVFKDDIINTAFEISNTLALAIAQADLQENIKMHAENLQRSLKEKLVLLKEVHHRVKNNLQIISSLLYLQSQKSNDENVLKTLIDSQSRVRSMALVHEKIYKSSDFTQINVSDYTKSLAEMIVRSFNEISNRVNLSLDIVEDMFLPIDISIPFGLIVNEVLTNIMKHAFTEQNKGNIAISISKNDDEKVTVSIKDDGKGLPDDFEERSKSSLGMQLIHNLTSQIDGELTFANENGTHLKITFSIPKIESSDETTYAESSILS